MIKEPANFPSKKGLPFYCLILLLCAGIILLAYLIRRFPDALAHEDQRIQIVSLCMILVYLSFSLVSGRMRLSETIRYLSVWFGIGLGILVIYSYRYPLLEVMQTVENEVFPSKGVKTAEGSVQFPISSNGHFMFEAVVEGVSIRFMLDTGASHVVLTQADALRLGLVVKGLSYTQPARTANGIVWSAPIHLHKIKIGPISVTNIAASVSNNDLEQSLLGMSFLEKLKGYEVHKGVLVLRN